MNSINILRNSLQIEKSWIRRKEKNFLIPSITILRNKRTWFVKKWLHPRRMILMISERNLGRYCERGIGIKKKIPNPSWIRLEYVRYADDWLVGVWGPMSYVKWLKHNLKEYLLKLKLELSEEKTLITNIKKKTAKFLGVLIGTSYIEDSRRRIVVSGYNRRIGGMNITMNTPIKSLLQRLETKGFVGRFENRLTARPIQSLTPLPTINLILRYRSILQGYIQYYSFADNIRKLKYIYVFLRNSLEKTICLKEKLTRNEFYMTYGRNIKINITRSNGTRITLEFACPVLNHAPKNFLFKEIKDPLLAKIWKISTVHPLDQPCANCGDDKFIEMHHVKHIRTINPKLSSFDKMLARINRKQVPLCRVCHHKVHSGKYFGFSLKHFKYNKWIGTAKWQ